MVCGALFCAGQPLSTFQQFSYQAVVRDANSQLLRNQNIGVRISILEGSNSGTAMYVETHNAQTDANGVLALSVGSGNATLGSMSAVHWGSATNFLKVEIDPAGGNNYSITSAQEMLSVPYALYAHTAGNGFSGNYYDLTHRPNIPVLPGNVSYFNNDAHYLTEVRLNAIMDSLLTPYIQTIDSLNALILAQSALIDNMMNALDTLSHNGFRCGIYTIKDFDGNEYNTLQIGNQCWMKENLRTTHYGNGMPIPVGATTDYVNAYRYFPNNQSSSAMTYGMLYNWAAVMNGASSSNTVPSNVQGICPNGWHLPSKTEWDEMLSFLPNIDSAICGGSTSNLAKALASNNGWVSSSELCAVGNDPWSNNVSGFTAMPAGLYNGVFNAFGTAAYFWTATEVSESNAYQYGLFHNASEINAPMTGYGKNSALSVRCVMN